MNKAELDQALQAFVDASDEVELIIYGVIEGSETPEKLDIEAEDLPQIRTLFLNSINKSVINKGHYSVIDLSKADERGNCFYRYDLDVPEELNYLETVIGDDNIPTLNFRNKNLSDVKAMIVVMALGDRELSLYKNVSPVEVIGRGGFILGKHNERLKRFEDQLLRISPKFQVIRISNELIITDLEAIERSFGFQEVIQREAELSLNAIGEMRIVENMDSLSELVGDIRFARKLTKIARSSPVIFHNIPNARILEFSRTHPATRGKLRYSDDNTQFRLDTKVSKDLFIKLLNDDFLTSELTELHYQSLAKDGIDEEEEEAVE